MPTDQRTGGSKPPQLIWNFLFVLKKKRTKLVSSRLGIRARRASARQANRKEIFLKKSFFYYHWLLGWSARWVLSCRVRGGTTPRSESDWKPFCFIKLLLQLGHQALFFLLSGDSDGNSGKISIRFSQSRDQDREIFYGPCEEKIEIGIGLAITRC